MANLLSPWGIDQTGEGVYRALLGQPRSSAAGLAAQLGYPEPDVEHALRRLSRLGLVHEDGGGYVGEAPSATLDQLISAEQARIDRRREQLRAVRAAIPQLSADHLAGQTRQWMHLRCDLVSGADVPAAVSDLSRAAPGELRCLWPVAHKGEAVREICAREQAHGRAVRTVVPVTLLDDPPLLAELHERIALGERVRVAAHVPLQLLVFGDHAAMIKASPDPADERQIVVHPPALVRALAELFDRVWDQAVSPPAPQGAGTDHERQRLLELLALGAKDETVARHLRMSVRTVRRRVAELLAELGASTRFQAGMQAARRGWI